MSTSTNTNQNTPLPKNRKWRKFLFILTVIITLICVSYVLICGITYSTGTRTGVVIKISKKGYVFKTYEGELNLGGFSQGDGSFLIKNMWTFSIQKNDTAIYNAITRSEGKQVRLHYNEVIKNLIWQSETPYFIYKVEQIK
jgi:hypothetical protein